MLSSAFLFCKRWLFVKQKGIFHIAKDALLQGVVNQDVMPLAVADALSIGDYMDGTSSPSSSHEVKPISSAIFLSNAK